LQALIASPGNFETLASALLVKMLEQQDSAKAEWVKHREKQPDGLPSGEVRVPVNDYIFAHLFADMVDTISSLSPVFAKHWQASTRELRTQLERSQKDWMLYEPRWLDASGGSNPGVSLTLPSLEAARAMAAATTHDYEAIIRHPFPKLKWVGFAYYVGADSSSPRLHAPEGSLHANTILMASPSLSSAPRTVASFRVIAVVNDSLGVDWKYNGLPFGTPVFELTDISISPAE